MANENREIIAAVLAAGITGSGKYALDAVPASDADVAAELYQHCLKELDRQAKPEAN